MTIAATGSGLTSDAVLKKNGSPFYGMPPRNQTWAAPSSLTSSAATIGKGGIYDVLAKGAVVWGQVKQAAVDLWNKLFGNKSSSTDQDCAGRMMFVAATNRNTTYTVTTTQLSFSSVAFAPGNAMSLVVLGSTAVVAALAMFF